MKLIAIHLQNFRRHGDARLELGEGVNILYGRNGAGKTNFLEAIHYAALTKSFINASDAECLKFGATHFEINAEWESDGGIRSTARVYFSNEQGKHVFVNKSELESFAKIVGEYPCVALSPFDLALVQGAPQERRRFLDSSVSQTNKAYLEDLLNYRRALTQRNKLLSEMKGAPSDAQRQSLAVWTESFAALAAAIMFRRLKFVQEFAESLAKAYRLFHSFSETPTIRYDSDVEIPPNATKADILSEIQLRLARIEEEEIRRGVTLLGAHRDDLDFQINGVSVRKFASQGQQKTFVVCLKLAQHFYIQNILNEKPIFLLDDVFSELDRDRASDLVELLKPMGQSIITTTEKKQFDNVRQILIDDGIHATAR
ncbi:MAG: DNA replication/repair protein RecF [Chloroherpetonaceae bacterium]|nr:DNA replication/repair protein RecF [Chloroherpetonaceae bacterium]MDW8438374.1 DNA replication/repair protein RecF [Chloroherpetonaceae bacterium]